MEIIKITRNGINQLAIKKAIAVLKKGGVIIYPTETSYGLGGDAFNIKTIKKIFALKKRSGKKPLPVIMGTLRQAQKIAVFNSQAKKLAKKYWPGPLTVILPKKKNILSFLTAGKRKIAIRIPGFLFTRKLAEKYGMPIISTSANLSGKKECYNVGTVLKQLPDFKKEHGLILDAGQLPKIKPSTIVEISNDKIKLIRQGPVSLDIQDKG